MFEKANKPLLLVTMTLLGLFVLPMGLWPQQSSELIGKVFSFMTMDLAWLFMLIGIAGFFFAIFIAVSKFGDIRLGGVDARPHYKSFTWVSMILTSALAAGILIFGMVEWMYYVQGAPFGIEPYSIEAYEYASAYGMFHWGFSAWAFYLLPSLAIGYIYWNKKAKSIRLSDICNDVLEEETMLNKSVRWIVDGIVAFSYVGGLMTTIGLGVPVMSELISAITGIPNSFTLKIGVIIIFCLFFMLSVSRSIAKGMAMISDFNVKLAIGFFAFIFIVGPKTFMLNNFTMAIGKNVTEFFKMSFYTDSIAQTGFVQGWTIFYWAWYVGLAILSGIWVARISYGRTFREITVATVVWAPVACWITFAILGNYGMNLELTGQVMLTQIIGESGNSGATLAVLQTLPFSTLAIIVFTVLIFFNLATTATASATALSIFTSNGLGADEEPHKMYKLFWSFLFLALPVSILILERNVPGLNILKTIQSLTTVFAIPILFVMGLLTWTFIRVFKRDIKSGEILDSIDPRKHVLWQTMIEEETRVVNRKENAS